MEEFLKFLSKETWKEAQKMCASGKITPDQRMETSCRIGAEVVKKLGLTEEVKAYHKDLSHAG